MSSTEKVSLIIIIILTVLSGVSALIILAFGLYILSIIKKTTSNIQKIGQNDKFMLSVILFLLLTFGMLFVNAFYGIMINLKLLATTVFFLFLN